MFDQSAIDDLRSSGEHSMGGIETEADAYQWISENLINEGHDVKIFTSGSGIRLFVKITGEDSNLLCQARTPAATSRRYTKDELPTDLKAVVQDGKGSYLYHRGVQKTTKWGKGYYKDSVVGDNLVDALRQHMESSYINTCEEPEFRPVSEDMGHWRDVTEFMPAEEFVETFEVNSHGRPYFVAGFPTND